MAWMFWTGCLPQQIGCAVSEDGSMILFYQGSADMGKTWYLSRLGITFDREGNPGVKEKW